MNMKVTIDYSLCMGDSHCSEICPEVFEYDDQKTEARVRVDVILPELEERVRQAAQECDPGAIVIEE
jgi:ferredoxin